MIRDNLKKPFERIGDRLPDTWERAQVGIGTLIVFIAMVLVAAIAAGVLINTAGFLQSSAEQTGEESGAQVTNQLQVISTTGQVTTGASSAQSTVLNLSISAGGNTGYTIDANETVVYATATASSKIGDGNGNTISIAGTGQEGLEIIAINETAYTVTDADSTSNSFTVNLEKDETLTAGSGSDITLTFTNVAGQNSDVVIGTGGASDEVIKREAAELTFGDTVGTLDVLDGGQLVVDAQDPAVQVTDGNGESLDIDADSEEFKLSISVLYKNETTSEYHYEVTGPSGDSIEVHSSETLTFNDGAGDPTNVILSNDGEDISIKGGVDSASLAYVDASNAGTESKVDSIEIIVTQSPGASDIDMGKTTINFIAPDGSHDLVYTDSETPAEDSEFSLTAIQDEDGTMPVLSSGDRFTIKVDPGTLEAGSTAEMSITTPSGATKTVLLRVPDSLANQEAVSI
ncbi:archaellin/type IV pilin N-terminal domain-containing protein [Halorussus marinus]|uniref:archaellin/type IV pilin N-terminal domain-containing protein n=1 Tax=Halorussus marinus TaxID=2505976 RepID=UPI001092987F